MKIKNEGNKTGKWLEDNMAEMIRARGFVEITGDEKRLFSRSDGDLHMFDGRWFVQQIRLDRNLYGAVHKSDFFLVDPDVYPEGLHIEAKWQGSSGSVDEKYVFTVLSMRKFRGESVMVLDGGGTRPCAVQWIKGEARKSDGQFRLMSFAEFHSWLVKEFALPN